jgi:L-ascorbate metabolism protein UlaG (beta-lactamase superfamily)
LKLFCRGSGESARLSPYVARIPPLKPFRSIMTRRSLLLALGALAAGGASLFAIRRAAANGYYSGAPSDHFDGTVFFNPGGVEPRAFGDLLRWQFSGKRQAWPNRFADDRPASVPAKREDGLVVTAIGHASFLYQMAGVNILIDPVWSERMSPVSFAGPKRVNDPGIAFDALPPIDIVIVTHNHYDHMDMATLGRLKAEHDPLFITPLGNDAIIAKALPGARLKATDWGNAVSHGPLTLHCEPCHHWSARGMGDRRHALWAAYALSGPSGTAYHVGDTGFHQGINYRAAALKHPSIAVATLPVGAYEPRWFMEGQHQNPAEAVEGFRLLGAARAIGHHWGTVQLTDEAVEEPRRALHAALDAAGIARDRFDAALPGDVFRINPFSG